MTTRGAQVIALRELGYTFEEIAAKLGITRQRAHQAYHQEQRAAEMREPSRLSAFAALHTISLEQAVALLLDAYEGDSSSQGANGASARS